MVVKELYRYVRPDGGVTTSTDNPDALDYVVKYRLIADNAWAITNGDIITECVDVDTMDGWRDLTEKELEEYNKSKYELEVEPTL